jgi:hypothetical protein
MARPTNAEIAAREAAKADDAGTTETVTVEAPVAETPKAAKQKAAVSQNWELAQMIPNAGIRCESDENGALVLEKNGTIYAVNPKNFTSDADVIQAFAAGGIY